MRISFAAFYQDFTSSPDVPSDGLAPESGRGESERVAPGDEVLSMTLLLSSDRSECVLDDNLPAPVDGKPDRWGETAPYQSVVNQLSMDSTGVEDVASAFSQISQLVAEQSEQLTAIKEDIPAAMAVQVDRKYRRRRRGKSDTSKSTPIASHATVIAAAYNAPSQGYKATSPAYSPTSPTYSPTSPTYSHTSAAYSRSTWFHSSVFPISGKKGGKRFVPSASQTKSPQSKLLSDDYHKPMPATRRLSSSDEPEHEKLDQPLVLSDNEKSNGLAAVSDQTLLPAADLSRNLSRSKGH